PMSAVYLGCKDDAILLGVTEQLVGISWLNSGGLHYAGNIGPVSLPEQQADAWHRLGTTLACRFHLRGLFGIDAIERDGIPWPVEINPRYTASIEILERSSGVAFLAGHRDVFLGKTPSVRATEDAICGKAILYARTDIAFPSEGPWTGDAADLDQRSYADVPHAGEFIEAGSPILTIFASGSTVIDCRSALQEMAEALDRRLGSR
ncbi:MAG TPA: ATP-grasp domain-containing protein, partial [Gemmataceae bacterium]|nr:ATP-grasp domain-containing protein [Gemmataceae bacterium]